MDKTKDGRRFRARALVLTAVCAVLATLALLAAAVWLVFGKDGTAVLEGLFLVRTQYVGDDDSAAVADSALSGLIDGVGDRWSYYLDPERYQAEQTRRENAYVGIGVTVDYTSGEGLRIRSVTPGGPAEAAGLQADEIITEVDGVSLAGDARYDATDRIAGAEGTTVRLTVKGTDGALREVTVERKSIHTDPVSYEMLDGRVGYVALSNFFRGSEEAVKAAVEDLQSQGARALVFDMRNNGGGYLDELIPMLDDLLPEGTIFQTRSHLGRVKTYESDADCVDLPMAVLVNADTYSAAEIFAAELQEKVGAAVVGVPTTGKGYSQILFPLTNGGAVGLSTAEYFTGEGVSLIGTGLTLDKEVALSDEDAAKQKAGVLPKEEDAQLQAALEQLQN